MARALTFALDAAMTAERRRPDFRVEIWDLRSTASDPVPTRINQIVLSNIGQAIVFPDIVGPRDFTGDVVTIEVSEVAGDYTDQGVAATTLTLTIVDAVGDLDPIDNPPSAADPEADGRWLRQGNVVVLREGDLAEDPGQWPITFTGKIQGQPSQNRNRTTGKSELSAKCASREVDFLRYPSTSVDFPQGTSFADMITSLATVQMGLDQDELSLSGVGISTTQFRSTQFVEESPLASIAKIMFVEGFMPRFLGNGQLGFSNGVITKGPARVYAEPDLLTEITRPILEFNGVNYVTIRGLDPDLSQVVQERQELARASITTGFFSTDATIPVYWSEDRTQQAFGVQMEVLASVSDALFSFGGESFTNFPGSDGGSVSGEISVDGGFNPALVGLILISLVVSANIPNIGEGIGVVVVQRLGDFVSLSIVEAITTIISSQGRGEYRIVGRPYEYIFREIVGVAKKKGILSEDQQELEIENHLLNSQAAVDAAAVRVYRRERAKQNLRSIQSIHDLLLEPDDIFAVGEGLAERRYMIQAITRRLERGTPTIATLSTFEVTAGVLP